VAFSLGILVDSLGTLFLSKRYTVLYILGRYATIGPLATLLIVRCLRQSRLPYRRLPFRAVNQTPN